MERTWVVVIPLWDINSIVFSIQAIYMFCWVFGKVNDGRGFRIGHQPRGGRGLLGPVLTAIIGRRFGWPYHFAVGYEEVCQQLRMVGLEGAVTLLGSASHNIEMKGVACQRTDAYFWTLTDLDRIWPNLTESEDWSWTTRWGESLCIRDSNRSHLQVQLFSTQWAAASSIQLFQQSGSSSVICDMTTDATIVKKTQGFGIPPWVCMTTVFGFVLSRTHENGELMLQPRIQWLWISTTIHSRDQVSSCFTPPNKNGEEMHGVRKKSQKNTEVCIKGTEYVLWSDWLGCSKDICWLPWFFKTFSLLILALV